MTPARAAQMGLLACLWACAEEPGDLDAGAPDGPPPDAQAQGCDIAPTDCAVGTICEDPYDAFAQVVSTSCVSARCHGFLPAYEGLLDFYANPCDLRTVLVNVPSAEYSPMARVRPGDPDNSWLYLKLTLPVDEDYQLVFTPADDWKPPTEYPFNQIGFGTNMPPLGYPITQEDVEQVRRWIEAGAPGPKSH